MSEPVRLVIWDLDETFWKGTLTEGGITYLEAHHAIVVELARRGIMSAICSKNDLAPVRALLQDKGLWDYFIFPSVDWTPKGPRLAALVEAVQLRAPTVLFIDDNPMNRSEAQHCVPGLQVADETIIPALLANPLCKGKDDSSLSRLAQYKLLEQKQAAQAATGDMSSFLRDSGIEVTIEHDLEPHYDRIIELINRTNQLNFTKERLPEDPEQARTELHAQLTGFTKHAGLIKVKDRYGDYGYVGFYLMLSYGGRNVLKHFCFSCRTLGMAVEVWLYHQLGRPHITVRGEVLTDLPGHPPVDWINRALADNAVEEVLAKRLLVRGGCAVSSLAHYLVPYAGEIVGEYNIVRDQAGIRLDHCAFLHAAVTGLAPQARDMAARLGYQPEDFRSALADTPDGFDVCVFNFGMEPVFSTYAHPSLPLRLPFLQCGLNPLHDLRKQPLEDEKRPVVRQAAATLTAENFIHRPPDANLFARQLGDILARLPAQTSVFILLTEETHHGQDGRVHNLALHPLFNAAIRSAAAERPRTYLLQPADYVHDAQDRIDGQHFNRMVFVRMAQRVVEILRASTAPASAQGKQYETA